MYRLLIGNNKAEKRLREYIEQRGDVKNKLDRLRNNPREELDAHPLHGRLAGKWSCWIGSNIRLIYVIDDLNQTIIIEAVGTHKVY